MGLLSRLIPSQRQKLANEVVADLRRAGIREVEYDDGEYVIRARSASGDGHFELYLENIFRECQTDPEQRPARIRALVDLALGAGAEMVEWAEAAAMLRPVLRSASYGPVAGRQSAVPLSRAALPFLREYVVVDFADRVAFVTGPIVAGWGISEAEVFATARENLLARSHWSAQPAPAPGELLRFVDDGNGYWVSRLLLDGWLADLGQRLGGAPIAFAPNRDTLLITAFPADGEPPVELYELAAEEYRESPRSLSPVGYTIDGAGVVVPLPANPATPTGRQAQRAAAMLAADEYNMQCDQLRARPEDEAGPAHISGLLVAERPDHLLSLTVWAPGELTWLPEAEYVGLSTEAGLITVRWNDFIEVMRPELVPDLDPVRYCVHTIPDTATVKQLHALSVQI